MRVITGSARGTKLFTLESLETRPTASAVKEAIFSAIQFDVLNAKVLDLFGGSGQLGIEALSRGADNCVFVDNNPDAIQIINKNLNATKLKDKAKVIIQDSMSYLNCAFTEESGFDIVLLDPPFEKGFLEKILPKLDKFINEGAIVICEHERNLQLPDEIDSLIVQKRYRYGKIGVTKYIKSTKEEQE